MQMCWQPGIPGVIRKSAACWLMPTHQMESDQPMPTPATRAPEPQPAIEIAALKQRSSPPPIPSAVSRHRGFRNAILILLGFGCLITAVAAVYHWWLSSKIHQRLAFDHARHEPVTTV